MVLSPALGLVVLPDVSAFCILPFDIVSNVRSFHIVRDREDDSMEPKSYVKHPGGGCDLATINNFVSKASSFEELRELGLNLGSYASLSVQAPDGLEQAAHGWRGMCNAPDWNLLLKITATSELLEEVGCVILPRNLGSLIKVLERHIPNQRRELADLNIPHVRAIFACDVPFEDDSPKLHKELAAHYILTSEEICEFGPEFAPDHLNAFTMWFDAFMSGGEVQPLLDCRVSNCVYCDRKPATQGGRRWP